jgi:hypothetical protein
VLDLLLEPSVLRRLVGTSSISVLSICVHRFAVLSNCTIENNWFCLVRGV